LEVGFWEFLDIGVWVGLAIGIGTLFAVVANILLSTVLFRPWSIPFYSEMGVAVVLGLFWQVWNWHQGGRATLTAPGAFFFAAAWLNRWKKLRLATKPSPDLA
jgi:hypothetical protein